AMRVNRESIFLISVIVIATSAGWAALPSKTSSDATLSSDEMELINNGGKAVFTGHVVLDRPPYQLKAKKMTRTENNGLVEAEGRIIGTWKGEAGAQLQAQGDHGRYDPATQIAELWTDPNKQVAVNWKDERGRGDFLSDRAVMFVSSRTVRLVDHV